MYRFRLETLLRRRKQIEDRRQTELSAQRVEFDQANRALQRMESLRTKTRGELKNRLTLRTTVADLIAFNTYLHRLTEDVDKQKKEVAEAQQKVDEKRALLVDAAKNRKILDKLKEKQSLAHMQRSMRNEQNFMNEIAGNRHQRQRQPAK